MRKILVFFLLFSFFASFCVPMSYAVEDPLKVPNNKIGIHILFPTELDNAAKLINSSGGDWGYVTIPIQNTDMDLTKWQAFMDKCRSLHIIPLIRLATSGDYFNTQDWSKPSYDDIIDFANFLNALNWPTKNRYVIIYNEVNRGDEWGGSVDPAGYATLLEYAVKEFKFVNPDFFVISAGMDNAAPNQGTEFMNEYDFYRAMYQAVPNVFSEIDGMASHSYPNPGFVGSPTDTSYESIYSFKYEQNLLDSLGGKNLPVFITETGWTDDILSENTVAGYYQTALQGVWSDPNIVAITPFLLSANQGSFVPFSLLKLDGSETRQYTFLKNYPKTKGQPILNSNQVLGATTENPNDFHPVTKYFPSSSKNTQEDKIQLPSPVKAMAKWLLKL